MHLPRRSSLATIRRRAHRVAGASGRSPHAAEAPARAAPPRPVPRFEIMLLGAVVIVITAFAFSFFFFDIDLARIKAYGYIGLFVISLVSAASIVMPMPGVAAITGAGALLDPLLGIPVPLLVGIVAGVAETLGELTGYAAGYGGSVLLRERSFYPRVKRWMDERGVVTLLLLSSFPNPLVDVAGVAAGASHMRLPPFFLGVFPGKVFKNCYLAAGGLAGVEVLRWLFD